MTDPSVLLIALGWGLMAALAMRAGAQRLATAGRARALRARRTSRTRRSRRAVLRQWSRVRAAPIVRAAVAVLGGPRRARTARRRADSLLRDVAVAVDLVGVAVGAGCTPYLAVDFTRGWAPRPVAREFDEIVRACALGHAFDDALRAAGLRVPELRGLTDALRTSARTGSPVAPALTRLASEVRADLRRRAEARARTVPVRLCFPLVGCILPAFALLTVVPVVFAGLHR